MSHFDLHVCRLASTRLILILGTSRNGDVGVHLGAQDQIIARLRLGRRDHDLPVRRHGEIREQIPGLRIEAERDVLLLQGVV